MRIPRQCDPHASGEHARPAPLANPARRRLLLALGAGTAGTAAAAAQAIAPGAAVAAEAKPAVGYRETEHVRDYYRSARI
jgi:hypothetical protein